MTLPSKCLEVIKLKFDPNKSELSDIFANDKARAIWCLYRNSHIISGGGLTWLNGLCRIIIKENRNYRKKTAEKILKALISNLQSVEYSMHHEENDWVENVIPYLTGEKILKVESQ